MLSRAARPARLGAALLLAVASVVLLGSSPAHACRCVFGDVGRQLDRADAVFVASFDRADRTVADGRITFDLTVDDVYRGEVGPTVTVRAPYSSATCGLDGLPAGEPVAWFVRGGPGGPASSDLCTGTTTLTPKLTRQLTRLAGPPGAPVSGGPAVEDGGGTSDRDADAGGRLDDGLPWWAWTALGLSFAAVAGVTLRRTLRRHP